MSYILEALKKSDQKRQKGQVPDLNTVQVELPPEKKKRTLWPYFLVGILLVNAVIFSVILLQDEPIEELPAIAQESSNQKSIEAIEKRSKINDHQQKQPSPEIQESNPAAVVSAIDEQNDAELPIVVAEKYSADNVPGGKAESPEDDVSEFVADIKTEMISEEVQTIPIQEKVTADTVLAAEKTEEEVELNLPEPESVIASRENTVIASEPEPVEIPFISEESIKASEINSIPQRQYAAPEPPSPPVEKNKIKRDPLHFRQLPLSVQEELPEIHISAHVYFEKKPTSRLASINGKIVREGNTLIPYLKVEEITSDGVIFSYHEYLFHIPIL